MEFIIYTYGTTTTRLLFQASSISTAACQNFINRKVIQFHKTVKSLPSSCCKLICTCRWKLLAIVYGRKNHHLQVVIWRDRPRVIHIMVSSKFFQCVGWSTIKSLMQWLLLLTIILFMIIQVLPLVYPFMMIPM